MEAVLKRPISWLLDLLDGSNVAEKLDDETLEKIGFEVTRTFDRDDMSRAEWKRVSENALKLAKQVREDKTDPWPGAANVKYPLLTSASIQFAARAYPEICKGDQIVRCSVVGTDPDGSKEARGDRIANHMNWQLTKQMREWEDDTDKLLHILPTVGCCFKKTYYDPQMEGGRNVSELVLADDLVVNAKAKKLEKARRITHRYWVWENDIYEKFAAGIWKEQDLGKAGRTDEADETDQVHEILEQHRYWDLDGDGYQEPYIVTVHKLTSKVLRLDPRFDEDGVQTNGRNEITRIEPVHYFTMFPFLPNPDGSFYPVGFGQLLEPINASVNVLINQLLDSGTLSNLGGGFLAKGIRVKSGKIERKPGQWVPVETAGPDLRMGVFPFPDKEPSPTLFQLLGMLVTAGKEISSIKDITGEGLTSNTPAHTALAIMEQGLKVFTAIYKRIYRALGEEFEKLYQLNARYLDETATFRFGGPSLLTPPPMPAGPPVQMGAGVPQAMPLPPGAGAGPGMAPPGGQLPLQQVARADYEAGDLDVYPVADPNLSTDIQRALKTQALLQLSGRPGMNELELTKRAIHSIHPGGEDKLFAGPPPPPPPPPEMIRAQAEAQERMVRVQMDMGKYQLEMEELRAKIAKTKADTILALAKAEDTERADLVETYKSEMEMLNKEIDRRVNMAQEVMRANASANQQGAVGGVAEKPGNAAGVPGA